MKHIYLILLFSAVLAGSAIPALSQDVIYEAVFSGEGSRSGRASGTIGGSWSATGQNGCINDGDEFFGTRNGKFEITNFDGSGCGADGQEGGANNSEWRTSPINIRNYVNISVTIEISGIAGGNGFDSNPINCSGGQNNCIDRLLAMVTVDNETYFSKSFTLSGSSVSSSFTDAQGLCGNQMFLRIRGGTQSEEESIFIERVVVTGVRGRRPSAPQPRDYCEGEDGVLQILNVSPNADIVWFSPDGDDITPPGNKSQLSILDLRTEDSGPYSAFVTDPDQGCITPILLDYELFVFPTFPEAVRLELPETPFCEGENVKLQASPTGANYQYTWIGPDNEEIVEYRNSDTCLIEEVKVEDAGGYLVLVSNPDFGACGIGEAENTLLVNQGPGQVTINVSDYCVGSRATIEVTTQNSGNYIYTWTLPDGTTRVTTQTRGTLVIDNIQARHAGTYKLSVANADGTCERVIGNGINITVNDGIEKPVVLILDDVCTGFPSLTTDAQGNGTVYWYDEEDNLVAQDKSVYQPEKAGKYYAIVMDPNGNCESSPSDLFEVIENTSVEARVEALENRICSNTQTTLTAFGGSDFLWSNGAKTSSITVSAGTYQVTVSNSAGCEDQASFTVENYPELETTIVGNSPICFGTTTDLQVSGGASFEWNNGTDESRINVGAGTYVVTVTDENGCQTNGDFTLEYFDEFNVNINGESQICQDGESTLMVSSGTSYRWSTGATSQSITVTAGQYEVTVVDANACEAEAQFTVEQLPGFQVSISGDERICEGEISVLSVSNGTNYLWSTGETTKSIEVGEGNYSVTVTNDGGCEASSDIQVFSSVRPTYSIASAADCSPSLASYQIVINTSGELSTSNGKILRNNNNDYVIELPAGEDLEFTIENAAGCSISETLPAPDCSCPSIAQPLSSGDREICEGEAFPILSVETTAINSRVDWYDAPTGGNLVQLNNTTFRPQTAGVYYAEVVNQINSCRSSRTPVSLVVNELPQLGNLETSNINCNNDFGTVTLSGTGDHAPFEYAINNGAFGTNNNFNNLGEGTYQLSIRNTKGCASEFTTEIKTEKRFDEQNITLYSCNSAEVGTETLRLTNSLGCDSIIHILILDGSSPKTYLSEITCDPTQAEEERLTLTNQYGCDSVIVTNYTLIASDTTYVNLISCDENDVGEEVLSYENQYGCDSTVILTISYSEQNMVFLEATTCDRMKVRKDTSYFINQFGCDSIVILDTQLQGNGPSDTTFVRKMTCDFGEKGIDTLRLQNIDGCDSIVVLERYFGFPPPPQLNITRDQRICRGDTVFLTSSTYDFNLQWLKNDIEIPDETSNSYYITEGGKYAVSHLNEEGCVVVSDVVEVMIKETPPDPFFTNTNNLLQQEIEVDTQMVSYQWYLYGIPLEGAISDNHCAKASGNYTLIATNEVTGCTSSFMMEVTHDSDIEDCLVSAEDILKRLQFKVYPNPHMDQFNITCELEQSAVVDVKVFDVLGNVLHRQREKTAGTNFEYTITTEAWAKGVYLLQINVDGVNYVRKVVKGE